MAGLYLDYNHYLFNPLFLFYVFVSNSLLLYDYQDQNAKCICGITSII